MPKGYFDEGWKTFEAWTVQEILKYRERFIRVCYKAILPKEIYDLAKDNKDMGRCSQWAKDNGWAFQQKGQSLLLLKEGKVLGEFRPLLEGGQLDPHLEFYAQIAGERLELVLPDESSERGILDLLTQPQKN